MRWNILNLLEQLHLKKRDVGYGTRTMVFPAQTASLNLEDSTDYKLLQIADILASTIAFMYNNQNQKHQRIIDHIKKSKLLSLSNCHTIWPYPNFTPKAVGMDKANGTNVLDFLAKIDLK